MANLDPSMPTSTAPTMPDAASDNTPAPPRGREGKPRRHSITRDLCAVIAAIVVAVVLIGAAIYNRHSWNWGDLPTWAEAIATIGLLIGAGFTVHYARKAFDQQSAELDMLKDQAQRDINERRRTQARLIYIRADASRGTSHPDAADQADGGNPSTLRLHAYLTNSSQQPIYDIVVTWSTSNGPIEPPSTKPDIMPSDTGELTRSWNTDFGITSGLAVQADFRDASGVIWRATDRGHLTELCGAEGNRRRMKRCTYIPEHQGNHSWQTEPEQPPTTSD